jgi:hypothetical protein
MSYGVRTLLLCALLLSGGAAAAAQSFEVPNVEYANDLCELGSESRVFVHAPLNVREKIVKILREHSDLQMSERPEDADFILLFTYTPYAESSADGSPLDAGGAVTARAELAAVKFVRLREDQVRPRILFYWAAQRSFHNISIPLSGLSPNGFAAPRSGKSAAAELVARLALWAVHKRWRGLSFDQLSDQLTVSKGGKFEVSAAKTFLKELKSARSEDYRRSRCAPRPAPIPAGEAAMATPTPRVAFPDPPATTVELPRAQLMPMSLRAQSRQSLSRAHSRQLGRSKKARLAKRHRRRGVRH